MTFSFHPAAAEEFEAAVAWYEERAPGLGLDFATEVRAAIRLVLTMPFAWPELETDIRRILVHRFPYSLLYCPEGNHLRVLAVVHLRRKPGYWRERLAALK